MKRISRAAFAVAGAVAAAGVGLGVFIGSGVYNIGADDHHPRIVLALIEQLRDRSIGVRARAGRIAAGARSYAALCVSCHLAPGVTQSDLRPGLYPHPPNLSQQDPRAARREFWVVKHGIKMSAMPAWGRTLNDAAIWDIVAFVHRMPLMTPEAYQQLSR